MYIYEAIRLFLLSRQTLKSPQTLRAYANNLRTYAGYLTQEEGIGEIEDITSFHLDSFFRRYSKVYGRNTLVQMQSSIRALHSFCNHFYHIPDITLYQRMVKFIPKGGATISEEIANRFFHSFSNTDEDIYDRSIAELLYGCGLKVNELCRLEMEDVDLDEGFCLAKNIDKKEERWLKIPASSLSFLRQYCENIRPLWNTQGLSVFFVGKTGSPLYRQYVHEAVRKKAKMLGENVHLTPQILRNSYGRTLAVHMGLNVEDIQERMGYKSRRYAEGFAQMNIEKLQREYERCFKMP